jgi:putative transcriptional regulator
MIETSLHSFLAGHADDPAVRLLAETAATLRADADYIRRRDDLAAAVFLEDETPATLTEDALAQVLARIERQADLDRRAEAPAPGKLGASRAEIARLPSPLREAALAALDARGWNIPGPGLRRVALVAGHGCEAELGCIEPGRGVPLHDHGGDELVLILTGAFSDGIARYGPGDISLARPGVVHTPVAEPGEPCYVLGISWGQPRFFGLLGFVQRVLGLLSPRKAPGA